MRALIQTLQKAEPKKVVIVGDFMLDQYLIGDVERISPEAPIPVIREKKQTFRLGGAANVAINCKQIGCHVDLIGFVGKSDTSGNRLITMLQEKGISSNGVVYSDQRQTTVKKRIVSQGQQLLRIDKEDTQSQSKEEHDALVCKIHTIIQPDSIVLISDYAKGVITNEVIAEVVARARHCNALVLVDPKGPDFSMYKGVSYIKPNLKEFYQMVSFFGFNRDDSMVENGRKICEELSIEGIIVTMGAKGLQFISRTKQIVYPAYKKEVYDVTGAGDTVLAFMAVGLVNNFSMDDSLRLANYAASIAVSHHKTHAVNFNELLEENVTFQEKIYLDWKSLKRELDTLMSESDKKIVFTNGCFDLLHSGHLYVLQEAKKRGDLLLVAINTDASVKRFKGADRPMKSLEERAKLIAAMEMVDFVVTFDEDTPEKLIRFLKPDVLVKGGDYKVESLAGYDVVKSYGGTVEVVEYKQGLSTTNLIKHARQLDKMAT